MDADFDIREVPDALPHAQDEVNRLLAANGLRREPTGVYIGIYNQDDHLVGGGGLDTRSGIIKCLALDESLRGSGAANALVSRLRSEARLRGFRRVVVTTKPEYEPLFRDMAFYPVARCSKAVIMESTPRGLGDYCKSLAQHRRPGHNGIIVMNGNPFTKGHLHLITTAAAEVDWLYILVVEEDRSDFPYLMRRAMIENGVRRLSNVTVLSTGPYSVSAETFPSYFLKRIDDATDVSIALDLDIFCRHIAPALGVEVRYAGTEPSDPLTARYNQLMAEILPTHGIRLREIKRVEDNAGPISASALRRAIADRRFADALAMHAADPQWLLAWMARRALYAELNLTPKPGLVDRHDNGAHTDMDYDLMARSIEAVTRGLVDIAADTASIPDKTRGIAAEQLMFDATEGVNTHKGAVFAMGLTLFCAHKLIRQGHDITPGALSQTIAAVAGQLSGGEKTHGTEVMARYGVKGALDNARGGYASLFNRWLPYLRANHNDPDVLHRLLLMIIIDLDDTNVLHRAGQEGAAWLRQKALELSHNFDIEGVKQLNTLCIERNISPGGAADMLALTYLIDSITTK